MFRIFSKLSCQEVKELRPTVLKRFVMSGEEALERLKLRRRGNRGVATKYIQEAKQILQGELIDGPQQQRLITVRNTLQEKLKLITELDDAILNTCPTTEIETEIEESETVNARIRDAIEQCGFTGKQARADPTESIELRYNLCPRDARRLCEYT